MAEPCTADNGEQSRKACSRLAAVYPTSAVRHVLTVIVQQISLPEDVELVIQQLKKLSHSCYNTTVQQNSLPVVGHVKHQLFELFAVEVEFLCREL